MFNCNCVVSFSSHFFSFFSLLSLSFHFFVWISLCSLYPPLHPFSRTQFRAAKSVVVNTRLCHWSYVHHRQFQIPKRNGRVCLTFISTCRTDCQWGMRYSAIHLYHKLTSTTNRWTNDSHSVRPFWTRKTIEIVRWYANVIHFDRTIYLQIITHDSDYRTVALLPHVLMHEWVCVSGERERERTKQQQKRQTKKSAHLSSQQPTDL